MVTKKEKVTTGVEIPYTMWSTLPAVLKCYKQRELILPKHNCNKKQYTITEYAYGKIIQFISNCIFY